MLSLIIDILLIPVQFFLIGFDYILSAIPGLTNIGGYLMSITQYGKGIPETIAYLIGVEPLLWNMTFAIFVIYLTWSPIVQTVKFIINSLSKVRSLF